jgi:hypothetical protein
VEGGHKRVKILIAQQFKQGGFDLFRPLETLQELRYHSGGTSGVFSDGFLGDFAEMKPILYPAALRVGYYLRHNRSFGLARWYQASPIFRCSGSVICPIIRV